MALSSVAVLDVALSSFFWGSDNRIRALLVKAWSAKRRYIISKDVVVVEELLVLVGVCEGKECL
jgi:hypothetical protein